MDTQDIEVQAIHALVALAGRRVLEVGCGSGRISAQIAQLASILIGIDPDADAIAQAAAAIPAALFQIGSGEVLPFADMSFDVVLFTLSLHHQNPMQALREAARVVRLEGRVLIIEPITSSEAQQVFNLFEDETTVLTNAQAAIAIGPLAIITQRKVDAIWELPNAAALCAYPFQPDLKDPVHKEQVLRDHLGTRMGVTPIQLIDSLTYTLLGRALPGAAFG